MTTEEKDAEIERLKGELAEALRLADGLANALPFCYRCKDDYRAPEKRGCPFCDAKIALCAFLQKHTPPTDSDPIKDLCDALKERGMGFVFWVCDDPKHRGVTWEHGKEGSVATCDVCGKKSAVRPPPLNFGSAAAGESPSHSGGGEPKCICEEAGYTKHHPYCPAGFADRKAKQ